MLAFQCHLNVIWEEITTVSERKIRVGENHLIKLHLPSISPQPIAKGLQASRASGMMFGNDWFYSPGEDTVYSHFPEGVDLIWRPARNQAVTVGFRPSTFYPCHYGYRDKTGCQAKSLHDSVGTSVCISNKVRQVGISAKRMCSQLSRGKAFLDTNHAIAGRLLYNSTYQV